MCFGGVNVMSWEMEKFGAAGKGMVIYWRFFRSTATATGTHGSTRRMKGWTERRFKAEGEGGHCKQIVRMSKWRRMS